MCSSSVKGANSDDNSFVCTQTGKRRITTVDDHGVRRTVTQNGVVIDKRFPFNICSEIALQKERPGFLTKIMDKAKWTFSDEQGPIFQAGQLIPNNELFFIQGILEERPKKPSAHHCAAQRGRTSLRNANPPTGNPMNATATPAPPSAQRGWPSRP